MLIQFKDVKKSYGDTVVLDDLNLNIDKGEFVVLIGESGSGKTTTMKMINRLIEPTTGKIYIDGKDISKINLIELRRSIGYVIQKVGLLPHMTVGENIELVPLLKNWDKGKRRSRAEELLDLVGLPANEYYSRFPRELSGGQQQRIGIARAMAANPDIILMDEPFSALDPITREQLQDEMIRLQEQLDKTIVLVSHDMDEAIKLADKIAVMQNGRIVQYDSPEEILLNPANEFVSSFVGKNRLWNQPELVTVKDIMTREYPKILNRRSTAEAIERMKERRSDFLIVVNEKGEYTGYILGKQLRHHNHSVLMADIKKTDIQTLNEDTNMVEVINILKESPISFVPVVSSDNKIQGVVTRVDVLNIISDLMPMDVEGGEE
ncbi:betaine/proline/choline family ABC transporter ATP-binding protein [Clostridium sp.]|uniref:betaine/proline/choline family ABC transporter ATP-binding protein n=1 Tax=Clostridium sp. TaxID=1506 RepID=UPI0039F5CA84